MRVQLNVDLEKVWPIQIQCGVVSGSSSEMNSLECVLLKRLMY